MKNKYRFKLTYHVAFDDCGRGLVLRLRGPDFDGVTASNAEPRPDGRLYGANRLFELVDVGKLVLPLFAFSECNGEMAEWPE